MLINEVGATRKDVGEQLGEYVSQFNMGLILGISAKQVAKLEKMPNDQLPPAIRLACRYIREAGIMAAEAAPEEPQPEDVDYVVESIMLTRQQVAKLLGKRRQVLYSLATGSNQSTIKRFYLLALLYVQQLYGMDEEAKQQFDELCEAGDRYRNRLKKKPKKRKYPKLRKVELPSDEDEDDGPDEVRKAA